MKALGTNRWAIALIVSLAVNLFLAGALVTNYLAHPRARGLSFTPFSMPWAVRIVGDDIRPTARGIFEANIDVFRQSRRALSADRNRLGEILKSPEFDAAGFSRALAKMRADTTAAQLVIHGSMTDLVVKLTPEQRLELAAAIERRQARRLKRLAKRRQRRAKRLRREAN